MAKPNEPAVKDAGDNKTPIDSLIAKLRSHDGMERQHAREALVSIGTPAVAPLAALLKDSCQQVRWEAAKALGSIADATAAPALVDSLEDKDREIRWLAAEGLIAMRYGGLRPLLQALINRGPNFYSRPSVHHALRTLCERGLRDLVEPILAALKGVEPELEVPQAAMKAQDKLAALEAGRDAKSARDK